MEITQFSFAHIVLCVLVMRYSFAYHSEWGCPKVSLEERLLEKMVRIEFSLEQIEKEMKKTQDYASRLEKEQNRRLDELAKTLRENVLAKKENVSEEMEILSSAIKNTTAELTSLKEKVPTPLVAFSAYNPEDTSPSNNQALVFKSNPLNEGSGYNSQTGVFTAPVKGLYLFSAHICNRDGNFIVYAIVRDDETIALSTQWDDSNSCSSVNTLAMINAGQSVKVMCIVTSGSVQIFKNEHRRNSFNGVLLHK